MLDLIRASALDGYCALVRELGGDPEPILAGCHLRSDLLGSTETFISFRSMAQVIDRAATELQCPDFSMRLATRQSIHIMGPIALIARHSATTRDALESIAEHLGIYTPAVRVGLEDTSKTEARYVFEILVSAIPSHAQIYQLILGVTLGVLRLLLGPGFRPLLVSVPHAKPIHGDRYEQFFGCRVRFDDEYAGLLLPSTELDRRRASHDPDVVDHVRLFLNAAMPPDDDIVAQTRHLISRTLSTGHSNGPAIAAHLGLHVRSLQRTLAKHNTTFEALLEDTRREKALTYLTQSTVPLSRIAAMLGYSEQSCLTRATARWFGASPSAIRKSRRAEIDP